MDKTEVAQIQEELDSFAQDGKITLLSQLKWLELKGAIKLLNEKTSQFAVKVTTENKSVFPAFQKKLDDFFYWRSRYKMGNMKTNEPEPTKQENF